MSVGVQFISIFCKKKAMSSQGIFFFFFFFVVSVLMYLFFRKAFLEEKRARERYQDEQYLKNLCLSDYPGIRKVLKVIFFFFFFFFFFQILLSLPRPKKNCVFKC